MLKDRSTATNNSEDVKIEDYALDNKINKHKVKPTNKITMHQNDLLMFQFEQVEKNKETLKNENKKLQSEGVV